MTGLTIKLQRILLAMTLIVMSVTAWAANDAAVKTPWGYEGDKGPAHWASLDPAFALCGNGKFQSPINISNKVVNGTDKLIIHYRPAEMVILDNGTTDLLIGDTQTIINDGHGVQLNFSLVSNETIRFNNINYRLVQFHIHTPSENKIDGYTFPLEIHFVHQSAHGEVAVISVFATRGKDNPDLQKIIQHLPQEEGEELAIPGEHINPMNLIPEKQNFYTFEGSLTTPPCSEGLQWIVMNETITASPQQIRKLKQAANGSNARPVQPLNNRPIHFTTTDATL